MVVACQKLKEDAVYPSIILQGNNPMKLIRGCAWTDPGFSVKDDKPGTQLFTTGLQNTNTTGQFYVDYIAIDADSNQMKARRVVNISPLELQDVVGSYQAIDTIRPDNNIMNYKTTISVLSPSPLLLQINNLKDSFTAFVAFDSIGNLTINYNANDTLIMGNGKFHCDKASFRLEYYVNPPQYNEIHKATFTKLK